jgi:charged multivesicular body protein 6
LKKANEMFSIEEIENIMDDTAEAIEKQREIDALLSGQLTQEDEDDVLKELDQLVADNIAAAKPVAAEAQLVPELPDVPSTEEEPVLSDLPEVPSEGWLLHTGRRNNP